MKTYKQYKNGTQFVVCTHDELEKKGWKLSAGNAGFKNSTPRAGGKIGDYTHKDFLCGGVIPWDMIEEYQGETLTVSGIASKFIRWYFVKENNFLWPVDQFMITTVPYLHNCVEGITPIDGWFICKTCGDNLREIK